MTLQPDQCTQAGEASDLDQLLSELPDDSDLDQLLSELSPHRDAVDSICAEGKETLERVLEELKGDTAP